MFIPDESLSRHKQAKHKLFSSPITSCFPAIVRKSTSILWWISRFAPILWFWWSFESLPTWALLIEHYLSTQVIATLMSWKPAPKWWDFWSPVELCLNILCWASYPHFRSIETQWTHALVSGGIFRPLSVSPSLLPATGWRGSPGLPGPLPPHHHYHQVLVVSSRKIIIVSCHENFDACKLSYHIYFTSICEVYNASRNRST